MAFMLNNQVFLTLFKSPDFVDHTEKPADYTFCPAEKTFAT
jgi:hypothetical protein